MNAKTVNNVHLAFLLAYLGAASTLAGSIAAWPARIDSRVSRTHGVFDFLLARHPVLLWLGLPSAALALHAVTRVGQRLVPGWWLFARDERFVLELPFARSAPIREHRARLVAWIGWFATAATIGTSGLMYGLGSLAITGDPQSLRLIPLLVGPILALSLVAFGLALRYGMRARRSIQALRVTASASAVPVLDG